MFFEDFKLEKELIFQEKLGNFEKHALHIHDVLEFHILLENEAMFQLSHKKYDGKPGDVFLFRPFEPHWNLVKDANRPIRWISILFSPSIVRFIPNGYQLLTPFYSVEAVSPLIPASSSCALAIHQLAIQAVMEENKKPMGWEAKQYILFIDILLHTLRYTTQSETSDDLRLDQNLEEGGTSEYSVDRGIIQTIEYILEHFTEEIDVEKLVSITGRRRTFFYRKFKAFTGITPNIMVHRLRMQAALFLLGNSDKSITQIAFECGYSSIHYFNKHFKTYKDMSPRQYRRSVVKK